MQLFAQYHAPDPDDSELDDAQRDAADAAAREADAAAGLTPDPNNPDAEGTPGTKPTEADKPTVDGLAALLKGEASKQKGDEPDAAAPAADDGKPPVKPGEKTPEELAAEAAAAAAAGEADADVEKQLKDLGIKNPKAQARFRELTTALGKSTEQIESLRADAEYGNNWFNNIQAIKATPDQLGRSLAVIAALNSDDPAALQHALTAIDQVRDEVAQKLGVPTATYDPLKEYPDLAEEVRKGEMSRDVALQLAKGRVLERTLAESRNRNNEAAVHQRAIDAGVNEVLAYTNEQQGKDPLFQQKFEFLKPTITRIQQSQPPAEWAKQIKAEFDRVAPLFAAARPTVPPPPATPGRVGRVPGNSRGGAAGVGTPAGAAMVPEVKDPRDALKQGMAAAFESEKRAAQKA